MRVKKPIYLIASIIVVIVVSYFYMSSSVYNNDKVNVIKIRGLDKVEVGLGDTISIMTFNIGWLSGCTNNLPVFRPESLYKENLSNCISSLKSDRPNIIAFQEIDIDSDRSYNYNQLDSISSSLKFNYNAVAINWNTRYVPFPGVNPKYFFGKTISAQSIVSDYKILSHSSEKLIKPISATFYYNAFYLDRLVEKTKILINGVDVMLINVHLEAFDEETRRVHISKAINAFDEYCKKMPTILLGDFNSPQYFVDGRNNLLDEFIKRKDVGMAIPDSVYSLDMKRYNTYSRKNAKVKIDFIFFNTDKIKKIDSGVAQVDDFVSDHFPVWMKFVLSENN